MVRINNNRKKEEEKNYNLFIGFIEGSSLGITRKSLLVEVKF